MSLRAYYRRVRPGDVCEVYLFKARLGNGPHFKRLHVGWNKDGTKKYKFVSDIHAIVVRERRSSEGKQALTCKAGKVNESVTNARRKLVSQGFVSLPLPEAFDLSEMEKTIACVPDDKIDQTFVSQHVKRERRNARKEVTSVDTTDIRSL